MTKYSYKSQADANFIGNSFSYMSKMILGATQKEKIALMKDLFEKTVDSVEVYPWGTITADLNENAPGICKVNGDKVEIKMWGYTNAPQDKHKWLEHEGVHEFCHSFADALCKNSNKVVKNGTIRKNGTAQDIEIVRENDAGMIKQTNKKTGEFVGNHYYGKMFNETMMDMITAMAINNYAPDVTNTTVDDVLKNHYTTTGNQETGYTLFTSITRLMISAFSNIGYKNFNYQDIVNSGNSMFSLNVQLEDGTTVKANDFLYGIVFDPLHIEKEFDKYMGDDAYRTVCEYLDGLFINYQQTKQLPADKIKLIMQLIPDFCNKKMADLERRGAISKEGREIMVSNFNKIWNAMQKEYGAYFSKQDINEIYDRARKY